MGLETGHNLPFPIFLLTATVPHNATFTLSMLYSHFRPEAALPENKKWRRVGSITECNLVDKLLASGYSRSAPDQVLLKTQNIPLKKEQVAQVHRTITVHVAWIGTQWRL